MKKQDWLCSEFLVVAWSLIERYSVKNHSLMSVAKLDSGFLESKWELYTEQSTDLADCLSNFRSGDSESLHVLCEQLEIFASEIVSLVTKHMNSSQSNINIDSLWSSRAFLAQTDIIYWYWAHVHFRIEDPRTFVELGFFV